MRNERKERDTLKWLLRSNTDHVVPFICHIKILKDFFEGSRLDGDTEGTELYGCNIRKFETKSRGNFVHDFALQELDQAAT